MRGGNVYSSWLYQACFITKAIVLKLQFTNNYISIIVNIALFYSFLKVRTPYNICLDDLNLSCVAMIIEYQYKDQMIQNHEHNVNDPGKFHVLFRFIGIYFLKQVMKGNKLS